MRARSPRAPSAARRARRAPRRLACAEQRLRFLAGLQRADAPAPGRPGPGAPPAGPPLLASAGQRADADGDAAGAPGGTAGAAAASAAEAALRAEVGRLGRERALLLRRLEARAPRGCGWRKPCPRIVFGVSRAAGRAVLLPAGAPGRHPSAPIGGHAWSALDAVRARAGCTRACTLLGVGDRT